MRKIKDVAAGLDLLAGKKKQNLDLGKFLDMLDNIEGLVGKDDAATGGVPVNRPYSGVELQTTERWK